MLHSFLSAIQTLPADRPLTKENLLTNSFLIEKHNDIDMYYAPHNEYINNNAKIVIVGITPGWTQMKMAFEQFIKSYASGAALEFCLKESKKAAGFAGPMRRNLLAMLDQCGIPETLGLPGASSLFRENGNFLHTTSIIKYPVFINGQNYTGHRPSIERAAFLQNYACKAFPNELASIQGNALVIPLGKTVERVIFKLAEADKLPDHTYLTGFPHPSGANGHRIKQFHLQKKQLWDQVKSWDNSFY
jgi:hypothetical protein